DDVGEGLGGAIAQRLLALGADADLPLLLVVGHQPLGLGDLRVVLHPDAAVRDAPTAGPGFIERDPARLQEGAHVAGLVVGHVAQVQEQFGHAPFYSATRTGRPCVPPLPGSVTGHGHHPGRIADGKRCQEISRSASGATFSGDPPGAVPGSPWPPATTWRCFRGCTSRSKIVTRLRPSRLERYSALSACESSLARS